MREFRVVFDGDLTDEDADRINQAIQSAVLPELIDLVDRPSDEMETKRNPDALTFVRPPGWDGMIVALMREGGTAIVRRVEGM